MSFLQLPSEPNRQKNLFLLSFLNDLNFARQGGVQLHHLSCRRPELESDRGVKKYSQTYPPSLFYSSLWDLWMLECDVCLLSATGKVNLVGFVDRRLSPFLGHEPRKGLINRVDQKKRDKNVILFLWQSLTAQNLPNDVKWGICVARWVALLCLNSKEMQSAYLLYKWWKCYRINCSQGLKPCLFWRRIANWKIIGNY